MERAPGPTYTLSLEVLHEDEAQSAGDEQMRLLAERDPARAKILRTYGLARVHHRLSELMAMHPSGQWSVHDPGGIPHDVDLDALALAHGPDVAVAVHFLVGDTPTPLLSDLDIRR